MSEAVDDEAPETILLAIAQDGLRLSGQARWYKDNSPVPVIGTERWVKAIPYTRTDLHPLVGAKMRQRTCKWWQPDPEYWEGACGTIWQFTECGPKENVMCFCPGCGGGVQTDE